MPTFSFSSSGFPFTPFTKILSADVNTTFNDIKTFFNTTKLDFANLQDAGITVGKLSGTGATTGQFIGYNGSVVTFVNNPLTNTYNYVLGSAAQVTAGTATNSTFASITQADGDRILILPAFATSESFTVTKKLFIAGLGNTSQVTGSVIFATGSSKSTIQSCRITTGITVNSGVDGVVCLGTVFFPAGVTFTDNATILANYLVAMQET